MQKFTELLEEYLESQRNPYSNQFHANPNSRNKERSWS